MSLQSICCTAWAAGGPEGQNLPLVDLGLFICLHVSPQEARDRFVSSKQEYLVEHTSNVTTDCHAVLVKSQEHSQQGRAKGRTLEQLII